MKLDEEKIVTGEAYVDSSDSFATFWRKSNGKPRHGKVGCLKAHVKQAAGKLKHKKVSSIRDHKDAIANHPSDNKPKKSRRQ